MMKSMLSGSSALRAHQVKKDVLAHNVANVNTNDFKSSRTTLQDSFSQTIQRVREGRNPMQVGSGVSVASIDKSTTPGPMRVCGDTVETMSNTDLAVEMTTMITAQRGFEANTRVITVADEMLEELVDLKA